VGACRQAALQEKDARVEMQDVLKKRYLKNNLIRNRVHNLLLDIFIQGLVEKFGGTPTPANV